ncbi:MAG: histone deacetylase family protein [Maricaulaceae bacterium]
MRTALITHPDCLAHRPPEGHPERPARLSAILDALEHPDLAALDRYDAPLAETDVIARAHPAALIAALENAEPTASGEHAFIDADTALNAGSLHATRRAAGAAVLGVDLVLDNKAEAVFCAVRPPGHHAEPDRPMGFCLFNSLVIAAFAAQARGVKRIAAVDFDVHHGNGTQTAFEAQPDWRFWSIHQSPAYPGTGQAEACGPHGNIVNLPVRPGTPARDWRNLIERRLLAELEAFQAELILVSAGFDAHANDPLADLTLREADYAWISERLAETAHSGGGPKLVSVLEGGYELTALAGSVKAYVSALLAA